MNLILWRHAEAEEASPGQNDLLRSLTQRGEKQAQHIARWLLARKIPDLHIVVSPAQRCQQTAKALNLDFETDLRIAPDADIKAITDMIAAAGWSDCAPERMKTLLLVGHQPTLGHLASLLLTGRANEWSIRKGAVWWLTRRTRNREDQIVLRTVIDPDMI